MVKAIEILKQPRLHLITFIKELSIKQLNTIPEGYNNNIAWNIGHMIAAQQGVCYKRAGLNIVVNDDFFTAYKSGTKPEAFIDTAPIAEMTELLTSTIDQLAADLNSNLFDNYIPWTTRYGVELTNIEQAVSFLPFHEGLHIGSIMAMRKLV